MSRRKTHEEFIEEMKLVNSNVIILGKYQDAKSKILCKCKTCSHEWTPTPSSLLTGRTCPICAKSSINKDKIKAQETFVNEMKNVNENIEILGKYINSTTKILCKCKIDNHEWDATPNNLLQGKGCPVCGGTMKISHDDFELKIKEIHPNIILESKYVNNKTKVKCKCVIDDYEWEAFPNNLLRGCGCHKCANKTRRTHEEFMSEIQKIHPKIEIKSLFTTVNSLVECCCIECGSEFKSLPANLLSGHGCNFCSHRNMVIGINNLKKELRVWTTDWKKQSIKEWDYKCVVTGKRFSDVHHLVTFDGIVRETFETLGFDIKSSTLDYKPYEIRKIKETLNNLHTKYGFGIPLVSEIHILFHRLYGSAHCTKRDMYDFILRLMSNEFDDYLMSNNIQLNIHKNLLKYLEEVA